MPFGPMRFWRDRRHKLADSPSLRERRLRFEPLETRHLLTVVPGITVDPTSGLETSETGNTADFDVVLDCPPTADVTIGVSSDDTTEGTVSTSLLTFTSANWDTPQTVTVTGVDDALDDGDVAYNITLAPAVSTDLGFLGLDPDDVAVTNLDDDAAGITVNPTSGLTTDESGANDTFTVVLDSQPLADVTIAVASDDTTEGTTSTSQLTFTTANWSTAQTVTVTGVDDALADGDIAYNITLSPAVSTDPGYLGLDPDDVAVTNQDDDVAGVTVTPTSGLVTDEGGGNDTFTVVLDSQPTADVTIAVSSDDTTEGTASTSQLTFTSANWDTAQTVTVTGVDDDIADGDIAYNITLSPAVSTDLGYLGLDPDDVAVTNQDDDATGITVTPTSGLVTDESGGNDTFTVVLDSQPLADVTIAVASDDTTEGTASTSQLTFTAANWDTAQTVTVTGVDDEVADGDIAYNITLAPAVSTDPGYLGLDADDVAVTNQDNDAAGITVTPTSGLVTDEGGGNDTFTVVLDSQPLADVTIPVASDDPTEGLASTTQLTFTTANWNTAQTVTVTGADDPLADGDIAYNITLAPATSTDPGYLGLDPDDVAVTNLDNDTPGITVTPTSGLTTDEAGGNDTFTVVLDSQPTANVTIGVASDDTTEGTTSSSQLTFTSANWNSAQTVTVTGVDDGVADGDIAYNITLSPAVSTDTGYLGLDADDVAVTNLDDDVPGITVTPTSGLTTDEAGGNDTFSVVLDSQPLADVTIAVASDDTTEGTASTSQLTFTSGNWDTAQTVTVTGADDGIADGDIAYNITLAPAVSTDPSYLGLDADDVAVTNLDDDATGITVTPTSGLTTDEAGGNDTFTVVLDSQPLADVTIAVASDDTTEGTASTSQLTFTTANWDTAQTVTVTGADDGVADGDIAYNITLAPAVSTDPGYLGLDADDVAVTNLDDDATGITVTPTSGLVTDEAGGNDTFTVVLDSQPLADVTISVSSDDPTEGTASTSQLTFTTANWDTAQTVIVTGADDGIADGDIAYNITLSPAVSTDLGYLGLDPDDVAVTNQDDDAVGITVTPTSGLVTDEGGGNDTFTVVLDSQPLADVTIPVASDDPTEGTASTAQLTFTAANWNTAQTVTVTGADDFLVDGDVAYNIALAPASSTDPAYLGLDADDVAVTNLDNDTPGITVTPTSGLTTDEAGGNDTFTVVLDSQPTANVTIGVASDDTTEGTASTSQLTFTSANWNTAQTVTVTGVDDALADGDIAYNITLSPAVSSDPNYLGLDPDDVAVTNLDDDVPGITVTPTSGLTTDEAGSNDTFTVVLDSQPLANVTIAVASDDTTEGSASTSQLTFTSGNWNTAQTVTVTGVDDSLADGDIAYNITLGPAVSTDPGYLGLDPDDVAVTNLDDDATGITVTPTSGLTTDEAGGNDTFTVVLDSQPIADVVIGVASDTPTEGTASTSQLTFTTANWDTAQTVTVTGVDDNIDDGDIAYNITLSPAVSTDPGYLGLDPDDVAVTNLDDDDLGITVTPTSGLTTDEAGAADTFTVVLDSQPLADVVIGVASDTPTEGTASASQLTFTTANWDTAQTVTVTGVDDNIDDGDIAYTITLSPAVSTDPGYLGLDPDDVAVTNLDDDALGITVTPTSGLTTDEGGGNDTFTVVLDSQPIADVTIPVASDDPTEGTASTAQLTFTAANWNTAQTVTVTGADDFLVDGDVAYNIVLAPASSTDPGYLGLDADDVAVTNLDDDTPGITVTPTSGLTTDEAGGNDTFTVVLDSQPTADVTIGVASDDTTEGTASTSQLTFTSANWNTAQTVTVTGADDNVDDGDVAYNITLSPAVSTDSDYLGLDANDVAVTNLDDDAVGITVTPTSGLITAEAGTSDSFTVVLDSQPLDNVTIAVASDDTTEGTTSTSQLTFTTTNWNTAQTVTVTGADDNVDDGDVAYNITLSPAVSTDPGYLGLDPDDVAVTNLDDDPTSITVTPTSGLATDEAGGSDSFTVVLDSEPLADVTIPVASDDATEGTVSTSQLTFTPTNWNVAQTVTVTGVDDDIADGDVAYNITLSPAISSDPGYLGLDADDVSVTNVDDDTAGVIVTPTAGLTTDEAGSSDTFTVVLDSQPLADVTIGVASSDTTEGTASTSQLTFTTANWNVAQTVTVTGVDDNVDDGDVGYNIGLSPAVSADPTYDGMDPDDVAVTNLDDDTLGITVTPTAGLITDESGASDAFTVVLDSQPIADVTIGVASDDPTEGIASTTQLTFTTLDWNTPQSVTVTGADDPLADGDIAYNITLAPASSSDPGYLGFDPDDVAVTNLDDDTPGITVNPTAGLATNEAGGSDSFTVVLDSQPTANVTIGVASDDTTEGTASTNQLTFTTANWNVAQTVTVTGVDDSVADGDIAYNINLSPSVSADTDYLALDPDDVAVTNMDDDLPGVMVTPTSGLITDETGGSDSFSVVLESQPIANVTIGVVSDDTTEGTTSTSQLTFTTTNWNVAQNVTVTGVGDSVADGDIAYNINLNPAVSTDPGYLGLDPDDVAVTNLDNDVPGITVTPTSGLTTNEAGANDSFTVVLDSQPIADVTIPVASDDATEGTASTSQLTFTAANWNVAQTVTVTGADDSLPDGDVAYNINLGAAVSSDPLYVGLDPDDVAVTNLDNDTPGITVTPTSGLTTTEGGGSDSFSVVLDAQPLADVSIGVASDTPTEGTPSTSQLTFTPSNWDTPQLVAVSGVDDPLADGDVAYNVVLSPAVSTDPGYLGLDPDDVAVTNLDDDTPGITVTPTSGLTTTEAGGSDTFDVVLDSQPSANVSIGVSSNDVSEGTTSTSQLTFTSANWNVAQTVTVTGIDDALSDGDVAYTITLSPAVSSDTNYVGLDPDDVSVSNLDDDAAGITVTPTSGLTTDESGGNDSFTVVLDSQPASNVVIAVSSDDTTEGTTSTNQLTFTAANWNVAQSVTVTGVNDSLDDGDVTYNIVLDPALSADPSYLGLDPDDVEVTNLNDDTVGVVVVTPVSGLVTSEGGGTDTFDVVLASQPTANVTIGLSSDDTTEGTASTSQLTFTPTNWNTAQTVTVTGADDSIVDGDVTYTIVLAATVSADPGYLGIDPDDVAVTNQDDDTPAILVTPTAGLTTDESGGSDSFDVVLGSQPTGDVTITLSSDDLSEGTVAQNQLTFTSSNWNVAQSVTVTGVDDSLDDDDVAYTIVLNPATSSDPIYLGFDPDDVSVTNVDDDTPSISVTPTSGLVIDESGTSDAFTVVLTSQPIADVIVGVSSDDPTEGSVSTSQLTFTATNWNVAQTVTVTGVDDLQADGDINFNITLSPAVTADPSYLGLDPDDVSVTNLDDDIADVIVTPTAGLVTTEGGGTDTFDVVLSSQPLSNVTISVASDDSTEGTASTGLLTFTSANWNVAQTITVTGADDIQADGDIAYNIVLGPAITSDPTYLGLDPDDVAVTNLDDDVAGFTVTPTSGLTTTETGASDSFTVVLDSQPTANVVVAVASDDPTEGAPSTSQLTFTSSNWDTPQTVIVSGVDDSQPDGDIVYNIVLAAATSADLNYQGLDPDDVSITNLDNETPGITVTPTSGLTTTEGGGTDSFDVVLLAAPTDDVVIGVSSSDPGEGTASAASLTFTTANWDTPQTVTVTGVDDTLADGDIAYTIVLASAVSSDPAYLGLDADDVAVTNLDDDTAGITVNPTSGVTTTEAGGTATFDVVLDGTPTADVTISVASSDASEATVSTSQLTFTPTNWDTPQTVTITGVDDAVTDGDVAYDILLGAAVSADPDYLGLDPDDVSATNLDDDIVGITVTPVSGLTTTEAGGTDTFDVVLQSQPTASVFISLASDDVSEGTASTNLLTFTTTDWNVPQTVTITGVDDDQADGDVAYSIVLAAAISPDANYLGLDPNDVAVTNLDDDAAGVLVSPTSGLVTTEAGTSDSFDVVLLSEPVADVTIGVNSSDPTEGTVSTSSLTFTSANWDVAQTVTVTGVDDAAADGDIAYTIVLSPAVSADTVYLGIDPDDVAVTNSDDEIAAIVVTPTSGLITTEAGGSDTFTVVLTAQPTVDVNVPVTSSDPSEGTVSTASLTFTPSNWDAPQTVTVTGQDDAAADGDVAYSVLLGAALTADPAYVGFDPSDVAVTNTDDEVAGIVVTPTTGLTTSEAGGSDTFDVVLLSQPTADVTVSVAVDDTSEGAVSTSSLTFTAANWNTAQTVTVTGVDDGAVDGDIAYNVILGPAASVDPTYLGVDPDDVAATNIDDDVPGILVTPTSGLTTTESGGTDTFQVVLRSQPGSNVTIFLTSNDLSEGTLSTNVLTFTSANWDTAQTVTVTGVDDNSADGDVPYTITLAPAVSVDPDYAGENPDDVSVTNLDDDTAAIQVTPTSGLVTTETGDTAGFEVVLGSQPTDNVVINVASSDPTEGTVSTNELTFTPANWNTAQTVTVTGMDDDEEDGDTVYQIVLSPAVSQDPAYLGQDPADPSVVNLDDETSNSNPPDDDPPPVDPPPDPPPPVVDPPPTVDPGPDGTPPPPDEEEASAGGGGGTGPPSATTPPKQQPPDDSLVDDETQEYPLPDPVAVTPPAPTPEPVEPSIEDVTDVTVESERSDSSIRVAAEPELATEEILETLDEVQQELEAELSDDIALLDTTGAFLGAASVGYVLWSLNAAHLMWGILAATPSWKGFDPMSILVAAESSGRRKENGEEDEDDESLQSLLA